ncbi:phage tail tape measure protein [Photorhabdus luminescens]|uniref:phage tail tape measure protein n=1 Tax=Photorhabdus luminescens TaxID=29488 RepID=UPI0022404ED2|nr:phage tail tape measure protein [Photorhabdus luminescens]MCW7764317.1 phage tail tape measure protein [Photorhabdus luminescens subsp. venezuelensis]
MSDIATISLRLDTADLERGNQELNKFQSVAEKASKASSGLNDNFKVGAEIREKHIKRLRDEAEGVSKEADSFQKLINKISPATAALNKLGETQRRLNRLWREGSVPDDDYKNYQEILASTEIRLGRFAQAETEAGKAALINADKLSKARNNFAQKLHEQVFLYGASKSQMLEYKAAQLGVSKEMTPLITQIKRQEEAERRATEQKKAAEIASRGLKRALAEQAQEERAATTAAERAHRERQAFLSKLRDEVATQNMSRQELLKYRAAQLNVSSAADIYIKKLSKVGNATHDFSLKTAAARKELGVMIGELARGNFGALRGSGITLANRSGLIDQLMSLRGMAIAGVVGGVAASVYVLGKAYYQGSQESVEFNKQLILTGNYAGKTASQLGQLAKSLSGNGITQGDMAGVLAKVVGSGSFTGGAVEMVANTAAKMEKDVGQSVDETVKQFQRLQDEPTKASEELSKKLHYLTSAQYEYIASLERRGDKELAGKYAIEVYGQSQQQVAEKVANSMGLIERVAKAGKKQLSEFWDAALDIGRGKGDYEILDQINKDMDSLNKRIEESKKSSSNWYGPLLGSSDELEKSLKAKVNSLEITRKEVEFRIKAREEEEKTQNKARRADEARTQSLIYQNNILKEAATWQQKRALALKELWGEVAKAPDKWSGEQRKIAVDTINKRHEKPKDKEYRIPTGMRAQEAASGQLLALQAELKVLNEHKSINDVISAQRRQLWTEQAKFSIIEDAASKRKLTNDERSLLLSKDAILAEKEKLANIGDQIEKQKQLNSMRDTATKFIDQQKAATNSILNSAGVSDREGQRNREREQLKLSSKNSDFDQMWAAQEERYKKDDELRGNWELGFKKGFAEFGNTATDVYGNVANISQNAFMGMSNSLSDFLTTGKADFKDFATSVLKQITQMITQMLVFKSIEMGASAFGFSLPGMSSGGYTGPGGKYEPRGIVHGGEFVFTKEATNRIGVGNLYSMMHSAQGYANGGYVGGSTVPLSQTIQPVQRYGMAPTSVIQNNVTVVLPQQQQQNQVQSSIDASGIQKQVEYAVNDAINKQLTRTGTPLWNAMYGKR